MSIKRIEIYTGTDNQTYWRVVAGNYEKVAPGEGYQRKQGALGAALLIATIPPDVEFVDLTGDEPVTLTIEQVREIVDSTGGEAEG